MPRLRRSQYRNPGISAGAQKSLGFQGKLQRCSACGCPGSRGFRDPGKCAMQTSSRSGLFDAVSSRRHWESLPTRIDDACSRSRTPRDPATSSERTLEHPILATGWKIPTQANPAWVGHPLDGRLGYPPTNKSRIGNIVMQPLSGGTPIGVTGFHDKTLFDFAYDWKHEKLVVARGADGGNIVLITLGGTRDLPK